MYKYWLLVFNKIVYILSSQYQAIMTINNQTINYGFSTECQSSLFCNGIDLEVKVCPRTKTHNEHYDKRGFPMI